MSKCTAIHATCQAPCDKEEHNERVAHTHECIAHRCVVAWWDETRPAAPEPVPGADTDEAIVDTLADRSPYGTRSYCEFCVEARGDPHLASCLWLRASIAKAARR